MRRPFTYRYELRDESRIVSTGRLTLESELHAGEIVTIGRRSGVIERIEPTLGNDELQLIVRLER